MELDPRKERNTNETGPYPLDIGVQDAVVLGLDGTKRPRASTAVTYDVVAIELDDVSDNTKFVFYPETRCKDLEGCDQCLEPALYSDAGVVKTNETRCGWCNAEQRCSARSLDNADGQINGCVTGLQVDDAKICEALDDDSDGLCGKRSSCGE